jgi:hypothetical protein
VQGLALLLVTAALPVVLWLSPRGCSKPSADRYRGAGLPVSQRIGTSDGEITYRFLYRDESGAIPDRLTLGRFVDGNLQEGTVWGFVDTAHWCTWAPEIFGRERGWVAETQPGWRICRWFRPDASIACDRDRFFWVLQALRLLDPESLANQIDMLEACGGAVRICATSGRSDYDYDTDTLYWNPTSFAYVPEDASLNRQWFRTDPRVTLAHELSHAWHDLCRDGDAVGVEQREQIAVATENRIRHILFLKDPMCAHLYPRPGSQETWPDLPGLSAAEAWHDYRGLVRF